MSEFSQLPGALDLKFVAGDEIQVACDFDLNITGYTITNAIYVTRSYAAAGGGGAFITTPGETVTTFDQTVTNAGLGQMLLVLPEAKSSLLTTDVGYRWYLRWSDPSGVTRTVLAGTVTVVAP